jgi:hypothetical protein
MAQMHDHTLDAVKGWFHMHALDFTAKVSDNETQTVYAGRVAHINDDGEYELGVTGSQMPIFLFQNASDPDVSNAGGTLWYPSSPEGNITGLVGTGSYELETTEFDSGQTYHQNDLLKAVNTNSTAKGKLTNSGVSTLENAGSNPTAVVGVVSRPPRKRQSDRGQVLAFWSIYKPGKTGY